MSENSKKLIEAINNPDFRQYSTEVKAVFLQSRLADAVEHLDRRLQVVEAMASRLKRLEDEVEIREEPPKRYIRLERNPDAPDLTPRQLTFKNGRIGFAEEKEKS